MKNHRFIESLKLEKALKIMKSNHKPNTTMPAKPCPEIWQSKSTKQLLPYQRVLQSTNINWKCVHFSTAQVNTNKTFEKKGAIYSLPKLLGQSMKKAAAVQIWAEFLHTSSFIPCKLK